MSALKGQYPNNWDEYIGQDQAKRQLRIAASAAKMRGANLGHCLLKSQFAGIGKTALGLLIAKEMDTEVLIVTGAMTLAQVQMNFAQLEDGNILFIDEIHKILDGGKAKSEWLLHYLQDGVLLTPLGPEEVPQVTVIGATTDAGRLPIPLLQRFPLQPKLVPYSDDEATQITRVMSRKVLVVDGLPDIDATTALAIARAASNRPRYMHALLESVRDLALVGEIAQPSDGQYDLADALEFAGFTADGLTTEAQAYLRVLFTDMRGQAAGERVLRERLGEVGRGLSEIEQLLLDKDLIAKTKGGRMLTSAGMKRTKRLIDEEVAA